MTLYAAALDCGSNSFHLIVVSVVAGEPTIVARERAAVQLASDINEQGHLGAAGIARALDCLKKFAETIAPFKLHAAKAVGTAAFRIAQNIDELLKPAETILGFPIEVISGETEADYIFQGAALDFGQSAPLFVVDIGGGSTELILGHTTHIKTRMSLPLGCLTFKQQFLATGALSTDVFQRMYEAAKKVLSQAREDFHVTSVSARAASGTAQALKALANHWGVAAVIDRGLLDRTEAWLTQHKHVSQVKLPEVREDRLTILPCGLSILRAVMDVFEISEVGVSDYALREGIVADLLAKLGHPLTKPFQE